jgi:short-subunit dehydrogenase
MKVKNKTIVITGAGGGMGRELCLQLLQKGARVAGIDINPEALSQTARIANVEDTHFKTFILNITDITNVEKLPEQVVEHFGAVDGIINNAGIIQKFISVNDLPIEDINRVMNVNFYGTVYMTKAFLPLFLKRPEAHIVNVSSMGGFIPFPRQTVYGASKAAVKLFTEGLYAELKDTSVYVTVIHPGAVATNITENSGLKNPANVDLASANSSMILTPSKAAGIIIRGIEKNKYRVKVGKDAQILDLLYRLNPKFATGFISKMMKKSLKSMS